MRKLVWWGMLGAIICAAGVYLAAGYASRHPDSLLANCAGIARQVVVECNPVYRLGKAVAARTTNAAPTTAAGGAREEEDAARAPDEPHPVDALLPDPAKLTAGWQPLETIDLMKPQEASTLAKQDDAGKQPPCGLLPENPPPEGIVPAAAIRSADEAECFRLMPYCEATNLLPIMPYADDNEKRIVPCTSLIGPADGTAGGAGQAGKSELDHSRAAEPLKLDCCPRGCSRCPSHNRCACSQEIHNDHEEQEGTAREELSDPVADPKVIEEQLNRVLQSYFRDGQCPGRSGVDTMEFRPSDARKGEFKRMPF